MKRNCLANEENHPNGCATYSNILSDPPIVTSAVEIVGVEIFTNDETYEIDPSELPIIVRTDDDIIDAKGSLNSFKRNYDLIIGDKLTVITTHSKNPHETDACTNLSDNSSVTVEELKNNCEVQTYKVPITE